MTTTFLPIEMIKIRLGVAVGVAVLLLISIGIVSIPDGIWYPLIQLPVFTMIIMAISPYLQSQFKDKYFIAPIIDNQWLGAFVVSLIIVIAINLLKGLLTPPKKRNWKNESFYGGSSAIGKTPFKNPNPFCPPKLDFRDPLDSDTERQTPACIADSNELTEEQQLDEIDIYLRDAQESIARINDYLNVSRPDERWLSKKEMDDPENQRLQ